MNPKWLMLPASRPVVENLEPEPDGQNTEQEPRPIMQ
jgi:hypothetical protein